MRRRDLGIELIVLYKGVKSLVELLLAGALVALAATGELADVKRLVLGFGAQVASGWSHLAAEGVASLMSTRGTRLLELGLGLDGLSTGIEGFALWRGYRWGPALVIAATAVPLPLEVAEIARTHRLSRVILLALNAAVVLYLALRLLRRKGSTP